MPERLGPRIQEIEAALEAKRLAIQVSTTDLQPEEVLVLETAGNLEEFYKAVQKIEGLDFLGEFDEDSIPPSDDFFVANDDGTRSQKAFKGRVYLVFTTQAVYRNFCICGTPSKQETSCQEALENGVMSSLI